MPRERARTDAQRIALRQPGPRHLEALYLGAVLPARLPMSARRRWPVWRRPCGRDLRNRTEWALAQMGGPVGAVTVGVTPPASRPEVGLRRAMPTSRSWSGEDRSRPTADRGPRPAAAPRRIIRSWKLAPAQLCARGADLITTFDALAPGAASPAGSDRSRRWRSRRSTTSDS